MLSFILHLYCPDNKRLTKLFLSIFCSLFFGFKYNLLLDIKKCPECYGNELCGFFQSNQIQLSFFSYVWLIFNPVWTKNVFFGVFNETEIVIKRKSARINFKEFNQDTVILCPGVNDVQFLFDSVQNKIQNAKLWLDLKASIEPLLLVYFQSQGIWLFPQYQGACGDLIIEEYKGKPLVNFLSSNFQKRCQIAANLLQMAYLFTFQHPTFAFYFTDYSLYNLVVDSDGRVSLIDLDNLIIFNKSASEEGFKNSHTSEVLDDYKYSFSPHNICNHSISDHNYFSVCKYLLTYPEDGLLNEIPKDFNQHEELVELLSECAQPKRYKDRFSAGQKLQLLLEDIVGNYDWQ